MAMAARINYGNTFVTCPRNITDLGTVAGNSNYSDARTAWLCTKNKLHFSLKDKYMVKNYENDVNNVSTNDLTRQTAVTAL